jgi:hypothetical protein
LPAQKIVELAEQLEVVQAKKAEAKESVAERSTQLSTDHGSTHLKIAEVVA